MMIDRETGQAIAALMHQLRPEWDTPGCLAAVGKLARLDPLNVAMAAVRLCATPEAETPMALTKRDGQHWRERIAQSPVRFPPKRGEDCPRHPGEWPDACRGCASERLVPEIDAHREAPYAPPTPVDASHVRAALRQATAGLCSHGVGPDHCTEAHQEEAEEFPKWTPRDLPPLPRRGA